jgi:hypothetical protein
MFKSKIFWNPKYVQIQNMFKLEICSKFKNVSNVKIVQTFKTASVEKIFQIWICSQFEFFVFFK